MSRKHHAVDVGYIDGLYSYALVLTGSRPEAENLVEETYIRAAREIRRLRANCNVKIWMFIILRKFWLKQAQWRRSNACSLSIDKEQATADGAAKGSSEVYVKQELDKRVQTAIAQLPLEFREVILLRECEEMSYSEIATVLNCRPATVICRLGLARLSLRMSLLKPPPEMKSALPAQS